MPEHVCIKYLQPKKMKKPVASNAKKRKNATFHRRKVLKMLAVMEPQETSTSALDPANCTHSEEFLNTGRTGRRNALPDILGEHAVVSTGDLPARLQTLTTNDGASTSQQEASTSKQEAAGNSGS